VRGAIPVEARVATGDATLLPDLDRARGWLLQVGGVAQSYVDLDDPDYLEFDYVRWFASAAQELLPGASPRVVHLGAGAGTLARLLAARYPRARQTAVDIDPVLLSFVVKVLGPIPKTKLRIGDARAVLSGLPSGSADLVVTDVFADGRIPARLCSVEFLDEALRVLTTGGGYLHNIADGPGLAFARAMAATVRARFAHVLLVGAPGTLRGRRFANLVLCGTDGALDAERISSLVASGPFPGRVVSGPALERFCAGAAPFTDATAVSSPPPPAGLLGN
jgi:tRNA G46 methylase TrmB